MQREINGSASINMTGCKKCGTCCNKGGPALHKEDKKLLLAGHIKRENLITIRKGELALFPFSGRPQPIEKELVKIAGKGKTWMCFFYDEKESSCAIYEHRPLECRLLKCWDPARLLSVVGKNILARTDVLSKEDPMLKFIEIHEKECLPQMAEDLISELMKKQNDPGLHAKLTALVQKDLALRLRVASEFGFSVEAELFYFGRPLFKILRARGLGLMKSED